MQTQETSNTEKLTDEEDMMLNRTTIIQLLEPNWSPKIKELILTVKAKITGIDNTYGWHYVSCNLCAKKTTLKNGVYVCGTCEKECKYPLVRYKIHLEVEDDTGRTSFVLFNAAAEKLLDTSAHKLFNRLSTEDDQAPKQIQALCGRLYIFKIRLNEYNLVEGMENYTITKTYEADNEGKNDNTANQTKKEDNKNKATMEGQGEQKSSRGNQKKEGRKSNPKKRGRDVMELGQVSNINEE